MDPPSSPTGNYGGQGDGPPAGQLGRVKVMVPLFISEFSESSEISECIKFGSSH